MTDKAEQNVDQVELIRLQMEEITRLRGEVERLTSEADAHTTLKHIYSNPDSPEAHRIRAAAAALPIEKPKLLSVMAPPEMDRRESWRLYTRWALKKQIILETHSLPPKGWDAHLQANTYVPPEGDAMPPVLLTKDPISGVRIINNLLPGFTSHSDNGNGEGEPQAD